MQNRWGFFLALLFSLSLWGTTESYAQKDKKALELQLDEFFSNFPTSYTTEKDRCRLEAVKTDKDSRTIEIFANEMFAGQSFSIEKVNGIYQQIRNLLPPRYQEYQIIVYGKGIPIEELVTDICSDTGATRKKWEKARLYRGAHTRWTKHCKDDTCLCGQATDAITKTTRRNGPGNVLTYIARRKTCSHKPLSSRF